MLAPLLSLALAAQPHAMTVDDLLAVPRVAEPELSPDGLEVAFTVALPAPAGDRLDSALYVVPAKGGEPRKLTSGAGERVTSPRFSPDGKRLAFVSTRGGASQAWVVPAQGGEPRQVTSLPTEVNELLWAGDGALLVTSDVDPACGADMACNERAAKQAEHRPHLATRLLFRHWTSWRERTRTHVLRVSPEGGAAPVDLTPGDRDVPPFQRGEAGDLAVSPDGRTLYFTAVADRVEATSTNGDLYAVPVKGGEARQLTAGAGWDGSPRPSPDGKLLAFRSQPRAGYESDRFHLLVMPAAGGAPRDLTARSELSVQELAWANGGKALRFTADVAGRVELFEVDLAAGEPRQLTRGANLTALRGARAGLAFAGLADSLVRPPEVVMLEGGRPRPLTRFGEAALADVQRVTYRALDARSKDGALTHGWIVQPPGAKPGESRPAVVLVHGGPQGAWHDGWSYRWNPMLWASQGWTVILPNPRGSTGWGQAYVDAVNHDWGGRPFEDILALTDAAVVAGEADPARTCAAGASYGGYMINWINGHTDRFRCLVTHAGDFDLESAYYDTEELWFPEWEMGLPWEHRAEYDRWSPHRFVTAWKTPTLVTHGELDYRVNVAQGYSTFTALQRRGIDSKLLLFPDEGHWILKPRNARTFHEVVFGWVREHLH
ncbi:S9 family peptidase [Anaeromyxobacter paludicola]|uniref:Peptidase S9 n=1 Tax=Anaeromyxobacter paludicola TaxID=2918171 RepID=A0ABN6N8B0_9BACT|nr:S9 family peptidase [Anaeromyxobacter paludicola]BDG09276.1 peptidase S9 [Anaeromyxobacter paludicola]